MDALKPQDSEMKNSAQSTEETLSSAGSKLAALLLIRGNKG